MLIKKPRAFVTILLFFLFLVFAGIVAITQEPPDGIMRETAVPDTLLPDIPVNDEYAEYGDYTDTVLADMEDPLPVWLPPGQPRWFRSNAGGMALEEIESRLAALRHEYALVIDYIPPDEIEGRLLPFFRDDYTIEIRVLYEREEESRRQWLLRDEQDNVRVNAVFKPELPETTDEPAETEIAGEIIDEVTEVIIIEETITETPEPLEVDSELAADTETPETPSRGEPAESTGFVEVYNNKAQIIADHWLYADDSEMIIEYFYNKNTLVRSETKKRNPGGADGEYVALYTDSYRYNRSFSLRNVERRFETSLETETQAEPVRLIFPSRVLAAAADANFLSDKLALTSEFLGNQSVEAGFRIVYDTDSRGRILTQTMIDETDAVVWVITNTWSGDRIIATQKTEGDDEKLTEYEYDDAGNRIVQRDINNGVLERQVRVDGVTEIEELYLGGSPVLRAYWENGRKIAEERVRR